MLLSFGVERERVGVLAAVVVLRVGEVVGWRAFCCRDQSTQPKRTCPSR
jgi:hypothetical protein